MPAPTAPAAAFFKYAETLVNQGDLVTAVTCYRKGLDKEPNNVIELNNLAVVFIELERYNDARNELEVALQKGGERNGDIYNNLGFVLRRLEQEEAAADAYEKYLEFSTSVEPEEAAAIRDWLTQVRSAAASAPLAGMGEEARPEAKPIAEFVREAEKRYDEGDFAGAIEVYNHLLTQDPSSVVALEGRGKAEIKADLLEEGVATLREADALGEPSAERAYVLGFALRALGKDLDAAEVYDRFLALEPDAENAPKIRAWVEEVRGAAPVAAPVATGADGGGDVPDDDGPSIDKQPVWAAALEAPEETYDDGIPVVSEASSEAVVEDATEAPNFLGAAEEPPASTAASAPEAGAADAGDEEGEAGFLGSSPAPAAEAQPASAPPEEPPALGVPGMPEPPASGESLEDRLAAAESLLADGQVDEALSAAQSIVAESPDAIDAKILIARCFGRRGDFNKAMPILKTVLDAREDLPEAWFFLGRCQQELEQTQEARASFEKVIEVAPDTEVAAGAQELLKELKAPAQGLCAGCMASFPTSALADVEGQLLCPDCRGQMEEAMGGSMQLGDAEQQVRVARHFSTETQKMRQSRRRVHPIAVVLVLFLAVGGGGLAGLVALKASKPQVFARLTGSYGQDELGRPGRFDPTAPDPTQPDPTKPAPVVEPVEPVEPEIELRVESTPVSRIMARLEMRYRFVVEPQDVMAGAAYAATFAGVRPEGAHEMNPETGVFTWTPATEDAGKRFVVEFQARPEELDKIATQRVTIVVLGQPEIREGPAGLIFPHQLGAASCLAAGDVDGNGRCDLIYTTSARREDLSYRHGTLYVVLQSHGGAWRKLKPIIYNGLPTGLVTQDVDRDGVDEIFLADWRHRALRAFRVAEGTVRAEAPLLLPARPLLICVPTTAAGVKTERALAVYGSDHLIQVFNGGDDGRLVLSRELEAPDPGPWYRMAMGQLDVSTEARDLELVLVRRGRRMPNVSFFSLGAEADWDSCSTFVTGIAEATTLLAMGSAGDARAALALVVTAPGGRRSHMEVLMQSPQGGLSGIAGANSPDGSVITLGAGDLDGDQLMDLVAVRRGEVLLRRQVPGLSLSKLIPLSGGSDMGVPTALSVAGDVTGDGLGDILFLDREGRCWMVTLDGVAGAALEEPEERKATK